MRAPGHSFSDVAAKCVHIVNLATVRELERVVGRPVDPLRFRANFYLEGRRALGRVQVARQGASRHRPGAPFPRSPARVRCEATNVDPASGARDMAIPAHLMRTWGHPDFGVYAKVGRAAPSVAGAPVSRPSLGKAGRQS